MGGWTLLAGRRPLSLSLGYTLAGGGPNQSQGGMAKKLKSDYIHKGYRLQKDA